MAEVLGLVSSVIAVAQVTGKLELLNSVLSELENQFSRTQAIVQTDRLATLSIEYSRQALQNLEHLVDDLHQQISSAKRLKRGIAKVKVTLKKESIRSYQERLQSNLQLLSLSQQSHLIALSRIQTSLLVSGFQAQRVAERKDCQPSKNSSALINTHASPSVNPTHIPPPRKQRPNVTKLPWRNSGLFWSFVYRATDPPHGTNKIYQARLNLPLWLLPKVWEIQTWRSFGLWKVSLTPWTIRSFESDVFRFALQGSTSELLRMFDSNKASLYDRNPKGWTLLHYAAFHGQLELFQKLVQFGLSVQETDASDVTPLYHLCRSEDDSRKVVDIYRYLSSQAALDEVMQDVFLPSYRESRQSSLYRFIWKSSELLDTIVAQYHPTFYRSPASYRFKSIYWVYVDPKVLLKVLNRNDVVSPRLLLAQIHDSAHSSLHEFARLYFQKCLGSLDSNGNYTKNDEFDSWRELLRWMFAGVALEDVCRVKHEFWEYVTPLFAGLLGCDPRASQRFPRLQSTRRRLTAAMQIWLEDLLHAGVNLQTYGEKELIWYRQEDWLRKWRWNNLMFSPEDCTSKEEGALLASFTYGSRPEDWTLQWDSAPEEFAADFWEVLGESSAVSARMPGEWVDD